MGAVDPPLAATLDELVPERRPPTRWPEIVAAAARPRRRRLLLGAPPLAATVTLTRPRRRRLLLGAAPLAAAAAAAAALVLAWPFGGGRSGSILQRAAAAIGDGPVVHAVIQDGFHGTLVDLQTGAQTEIHEQEEIWYDPSRGIHDVTSFDGIVQGDALEPPGQMQYLDKTFADFVIGYRRALQDGDARMLGPGEVDGQPVYWIRVDTQLFPDSQTGGTTAWTNDVAVDQSTYEPVALRNANGGTPDPDGDSLVLQLETLPAGAGNFTPSTQPTPAAGQVVRAPLWREPAAGTPTTAAGATAALGQPVLWAGASVAGLELAGMWQETPTSTSQETPPSVTLWYGQLPPSSANGEALGTWMQSPAPYVELSETPTLFFGFQRGVLDYTPPAGSLLLVGDKIGLMDEDGLHIALEGSSEDVLLAAAQALQQAPA